MIAPQQDPAAARRFIRASVHRVSTRARFLSELPVVHLQRGDYATARRRVVPRARSARTASPDAA